METPIEPVEQSVPASSTPRLGVASVVLSILSVIFYCIPFSTGLIIGATNNLSVLETAPTLITALNIVGYCGNFLGLVALILGGISIARDEKKALGIVGVVISLLLTCGCLVGAVMNLSQL